MEAAVGLVGEGALDEAGGERRHQVAVSKVCETLKIEPRLHFFTSERLGSQHHEKAFDLFGDLTCDLTCDFRGAFTSAWVGDWVEGVHGLQIFRCIAELEGDAGAIHDEFGLG